MNQQQLEQKAKAILQNSFDKNIKPLIPITFKEAEGENGYNWIYEAMQEYGEWMQGEGERQWISVKDRLPDDNRVLVHSDLPYTAWYLDGIFYQTLGDRMAHKALSGVTHWMPLPPKPQTEQP